MLKLKASLLAVAASLAIAPAASADSYDAQKCKQFISGTWTSKPGDGGQKLVTNYEPGGTYQQGTELSGANNPTGVTESGSWIAAAGASGQACRLTLTPNGGKPRDYEVTVIDDNTIKDADGAQSTRFIGTMEEHTSP